MKIKQILQDIAAELEKNKIKNPALEAEILLSYILKKQREFLFTYPEKKLTKNQIKNYKKLVVRRLQGEPIAYLTGHKEFYGFDFIVDKNALIPRPETELMVEEALKHITPACQRLALAGRCNTKHPPANAWHWRAGATIIDVGTGSGCIIISLAKQIQNFRHPTSDIRLFATDVSKSALTIARKNAKLHKVDKQIKFLRGNLLEPIEDGKLKINNRRLIILANLPYLTPSQINSSLTIKYEPKTALDGGIDGLKYYKKLFRQVKQLIKLNPAPYSLLCEIDPRQTQKIKKLAQSELSEGEVKIIKDLAKKDRIMSYVCPRRREL